MESNNPNQPASPLVPDPNAPASPLGGPAPQAAPTPNQPIMPQPNPVPPPDVTLVGNKGGGGKMVLIMVGVMLLLLVLGAGGYYYVTNMAPKETTEVAQNSPAIETSDLSSELQSDQPEDINGDFSAIDEDIQSL